MELSFVSERTLTQEEFAEWVAQQQRRGDAKKYELIGGRVVMNPPSGWPEGEGEGEVLAVLKRIVRVHDLGRAFGPSQGFDLPTGDTVAPDASFVSHERWKAAPPPVPGKFLRVVPDLLVEVTTPEGASRDKVEKRLIYAAAGVREYWVVDLRRREVTVFHSASEGRFDAGRILGENDTIAAHVLPEPVAVRELFVAP